MRSTYFCAFSTESPKPLIAPTVYDAASPMLICPAAARFNTFGSVAICSCALRPDCARMLRPSAASVAENAVVAPIFCANLLRSCILSDVVPIVAATCDIADWKFDAVFTPAAAIPTSGVVTLLVSVLPTLLNDDDRAFIFVFTELVLSANVFKSVSADLKPPENLDVSSSKYATALPTFIAIF